MHRINLENGSVLKAREYTLRGLPFIMGVKDEMFSEDEKFIKYFSPTNALINIEEIQDFYNFLIENKITSKSIHNFAIDNLSWINQMKIALGE